MARTQPVEMLEPIEFNNFGSLREFSEGHPWDYLECTNLSVPVFCNVQTEGEIAFGIQTHREDDMSYVKLFAPSEFVSVSQLVYSPAMDPGRWKPGQGVFRESWELEFESNSLFPRKYRSRIDDITDRGDTWMKPRCERPVGMVPVLRTQVQFTRRPLLLAYHNLVIAMPTNMEPQHGCARELLRLAPAIKTAVNKFMPKVEVGSTMRIRLKSAKNMAYLWLMFTRFKTEDVPELAPWSAAMERVMMDLTRVNVGEVIMTMPPPPGCSRTWEDVMRYLIRGTDMPDVRIMIAIGDDKPVSPSDIPIRHGNRQENRYLLPNFWRPTKGKDFDEVPNTGSLLRNAALDEFTRIKEEELDEQDSLDAWDRSHAGIPKNF